MQQTPPHHRQRNVFELSDTKMRENFHYTSAISKTDAASAYRRRQTEGKSETDILY